MKPLHHTKERVPYAWQVEACDALLAHFDAGNSQALLVMATGLGKGYTLGMFCRGWIRRGLGRVLFLIDRLDPIDDIMREFRIAVHGMNVHFGTFIGDSKSHVGAKMVFATFQSILKDRAVFDKDSFDLLIVDESHHGRASTYEQIIRSFNPRYLIGATATPNRTDEKDIRELFGEEVYELTLAEALGRRLLACVDYRLMHDNLSTAMLRRYMARLDGGERRISTSQLDRTLFLEERSDVRAREVNKIAGARKTIIFCRDIEHLHFEAQFYPGARMLHSGVDRPSQKAVHRAFRHGSLHQIMVVNKYNEGVDIPHAELLVFLRSTDSEIVWLQQLGRGLRDASKTVTVLDYVANCDRVLAVAALGREVEQHSPAVSTQALVVNLGLQVTFTDELRDLLEMLREMERGADAYWLDKLREYRVEHGDCLVPDRYVGNVHLGAWVGGVRERHKRGTLPQWLMNELNAIGFAWDVQDSRDREMLAELRRYREQQGDCLVPNRYADNRRLAAWVSTVRRRCKRGALSQRIIDELNAIEFVWDVPDFHDRAMLEELRMYREQYGDCLVPAVYSENPRLGKWVSNIRTRHKSGVFPQWLIDELNAIGFVWDVQDSRDRAMLTELRVYRERNGDCLVSTDYLENPRLGTWVSNIRTRHKRGTLRQWLADELNTIGFVWDASRFARKKRT